MTIQFDEKPSESVLALMKNPQHGYEFDGAVKVWYKKIDQAKPGQSRKAAEHLAFEAANIIRDEKWLEFSSKPSPSACKEKPVVFREHRWISLFG